GLGNRTGSPSPSDDGRGRAMPEIERPDGASIHYEVYGRGFPLLLIAPGGVSSQIESWKRSAINPIEKLADDFMVIGMDQRHAGRSPAPAVSFSYEQALGDQLAVLDAVGARQAHMMGGCIGCAYAWRLVHDAPERIGAVVCQNPVGLDESNTLGTFFATFDETMRLARAEGMEAVVRAAEENPLFVVNNGAGPFSQRIHDDPAFREEIRRMPVERYVALIVRFRDGMWPDNPPFFTVSEEWMARCPTPMLVMPGSDPFHPTAISELICRTVPRARCLDADCRSPEKLEATVAAVRAFLLEHTPTNEGSDGQ
ncbi:MAG: alpha/beta fold hydrolase, partial [Dehalococcoidia bacterium]